MNTVDRGDAYDFIVGTYLSKERAYMALQRLEKDEVKSGSNEMSLFRVEEVEVIC